MRTVIAAVVLALLLVSISSSTESRPSPASCPVTGTVTATPPPDPNADPFGSGPWFVNTDRTLWAGWDAQAMRVGRNKVLWIKPYGADLKISGRRLDAEDQPPMTHVPCCYPTGFHATSISVPNAGCWEFSATAGSSSLTFITRVAEHPRR